MCLFLSLDLFFGFQNLQVTIERWTTRIVEQSIQAIVGTIIGEGRLQQRLKSRCLNINSAPQTKAIVCWRFVPNLAPRPFK